MRGSGNRRILRYWHIGGFAIQRAAADCAPLSRRGRQRFLKAYFAFHLPALFLLYFENGPVKRVDQHVSRRFRLVAENDNVIENQAGLSQFPGTLPALADQAALENFARVLTDSDLDRLLHRDLRQANEFGFPPGFLFAFSGRAFTVDQEQRPVPDRVPDPASLFLAALKYCLELRLHFRIRFLLDPFFQFLIFLLGALFHFLLIARAPFHLPFFFSSGRWLL